MTMEAIGGHEGMTVLRTPEGIRKEATTDKAAQHISYEAYLLRQMNGYHAPRFIDSSGFPVPVPPNGWEMWTLQEDLGQALSLDSNPIVALGAESFFNDCLDLLAALREKGIYHGDLTPPNLAWVEGRGLCALDWQQSSYIDSDAPRKRNTTDAWQLLDTYMGLMGSAGTIELAGGSAWSVR